MQQEFARAAVYDRPEHFALQEVAIPELGAGEMLVEVELAGVDGSELHMFKGAFPWLNERAPVIFGDEIIGRVVGMGAGTETARGLALGDRVIVEARWPCSSCLNCARGQYYSCLNNPGREGYGTTSLTKGSGLWGGYATHVFVPPQALVYPVPATLPLKTALLACSVLANGLRWNEMAGVGNGTRIAIIGPGPQGLACTIASTMSGGRVVVIGLPQDAERLDAAERLGAEAAVVLDPAADQGVVLTAVRGILEEVDVVIEAAGSQSAKDLALALVRQQGIIMNVSVSPSAAADWIGLMRKEATLIHPLSHPHSVPRALELAEELLARGTDIGSLVTHTFPLEEAELAIRTASYLTAEHPVKVAIRFTGERQGS